VIAVPAGAAIIMPIAVSKVTNRTTSRYYKNGVYSMTNQQKFEIIKAFAYGEEPQQIAEAEGISVSAMQEIQQSCAAEIAEEQEELRKAGYIA
jgi:dihydroorotase